MSSDQRLLCSGCAKPWQSTRYKTCDDCRRKWAEKRRVRKAAATDPDSADRPRKLRCILPRPTPVPPTASNAIGNDSSLLDSASAPFKALNLLVEEFNRHQSASEEFPPLISPATI
ncbi:hypothetical protein V8E54_013762 [Elaphomyces granulatus]